MHKIYLQWDSSRRHSSKRLQQHLQVVGNAPVGLLLMENSVLNAAAKNRSRYRQMDGNALVEPLSVGNSARNAVHQSLLRMAGPVPAER